MTTDSDTQPEPLTKKQKADLYAYFMDHRKQLHDALVEVSGRYTQWIMTLSGGSLALSMTYVEKFKPESPHGKWLLVVAWVALCVSIVSSLLSLQFSAEATKKAIVNHDKDYEPLMAGFDCPPRANGFTKWTKRCSWISTCSFSFGVMLIAAFVAVCPPSGSTKNIEPIPDHVRKTASPPAPVQPEP
jgi:hypothetical protein